MYFDATSSSSPRYPHVISSLGHSVVQDILSLESKFRSTLGWKSIDAWSKMEPRVLLEANGTLQT